MLASCSWPITVTKAGPKHTANPGSSPTGALACSLESKLGREAVSCHAEPGPYCIFHRWWQTTYTGNHNPLDPKELQRSLEDAESHHPELLGFNNQEVLQFEHQVSSWGSSNLVSSWRIQSPICDWLVGLCANQWTHPLWSHIWWYHWEVRLALARGGRSLSGSP